MPKLDTCDYCGDTGENFSMLGLASATLRSAYLCHACSHEKKRRAIRELGYGRDLHAGVPRRVFDAEEVLALIRKTADDFTVRGYYLESQGALGALEAILQRYDLRVPR